VCCCSFIAQRPALQLQKMVQHHRTVMVTDRPEDVPPELTHLNLTI
jgi:hypothetical protein